MDPEIKRALANIRRRRSEIEKKFGKQEDDGPVFDKARARRRTATRLQLEEEEFDEEAWDELANLSDIDSDYGAH